MSFCEKVFHEGNINTLLGPPGSGKTNCAIFLAEKAIDLGFYVYTNIHFFKYSRVAEACNKGLLPKGITYRKTPPELVTVKKLSELLLGLLKTDKNIVILDESGIFASSTTPMDKRVRQLKELAYVIRHLRASFLLISQSKGAMSPALRSELATYELRIRKISKFYRTLMIGKSFPVRRDDGDEEMIFAPIGPPIAKIPLTRYPWDGFFIPKFEFDIDLRESFDRLGEYDSLELRDADSDGIMLGEKIVKDLASSDVQKEEKKSTREMIRDECKTLIASGQFDKRSDVYSALASKYNKTYSWAYHLCRDIQF